jgi:TIR domain
MSRVFISYRRDDSFGYAQTIYRELLKHYSKDRVFIDVDTVEPGVDFVYAIEKAVGECDVLLAFIGKRWANVSKGAKSRLNDPNDFVRIEISTALARDIRVIPVLVDGMRVPSEKMLPTSLKALTRRNAMEISHTRFNYDVEQLITALRKILGATHPERKADEEKKRNRAPQVAPVQRKPKKKLPRQQLKEGDKKMPDEAIERCWSFGN